MRSPEPPPSNQALIQAYLDHLQFERRCSDHSITAVRHDLLLIEQCLLKITTQNLKGILAQRHSQGAAPATLARLASSWRGFFKFMVSRGLLESSPALGLKTPRNPSTLPKAVSVDSLAALLSQPLPQDFRLVQAHVLIELLYCTGLRISEALSLEADVLGGANELRVTGKGSKTRVVPVVDSLRQRLSEFSEHRRIHLEKASVKGALALFLSARGLPLSARQAQRDIAHYAAISSLGQHLHPHMLRHSFGSHVLQGTQNLRAVQELLGHASIASTQIYTALDFDHLSKVYDEAFPRAK